MFSQTPLSVLYNKQDRYTIMLPKPEKLRIPNHWAKTSSKGGEYGLKQQIKSSLAHPVWSWWKLSAKHLIELTLPHDLGLIMGTCHVFPGTDPKDGHMTQKGQSRSFYGNQPEARRLLLGYKL